MLLGFARRKSNTIESAGQATLTGTSSDLYLWLWNRPSGAALSGDAKVAGLWRTVRVRWG